MMPSAKMISAKAPAIGLSASAPCDDDWMSVTRPLRAAWPLWL
jgi:hypothetical protein